MFNALVIDKTDEGIVGEIRELDDAILPDADVTVDVEWSSLNYKDGLVMRGLGRLVRDYPHVPGIDLAGTVSASESPDFSPGDPVVLTGWRVGEIWWGGYSTKASVRSEWLVPLPEGLSTREAMSVGTAGFTAMLAIDTLERQGLGRESGPVLVTGAAGGLGSSAVHLLSRLGYEVVASTGRPDTQPYLSELGASSFIDRAEISDPPTRPLLSERWAGCVDAVGGTTIGHVMTQMRYGASIASCGNAGGNEFGATVLPFLLRAVNVLGIDSVMCPAQRRRAIWERISETFDRETLHGLTGEVPLHDVFSRADDILAGRIRGRTVVKVS